MKCFVLMISILLSLAATTQNVAVNNTGAPANSSSMLDVSSETKGMLIPRMMTQRRLDISSPATGLLVYDTDTNSFWFYNNGWKEIKTVHATDSLWSKTGNSIYTSSPAFNTGFGTSTPQERLDVNGNINLQGNIRINGTAGQEGQVLMTNAAGATVWGGLCDYKRVVTFSQAGTWTVPAGVTRIVIEAWGGGGGGAEGGGGASGTYIRTSEMAVADGTTFSISIGAGGTGAAAIFGSGTDGGNTIVTITPSGGIYEAKGGKGAGPGSPGKSVQFVLAAGNFTQLPGNAGESTTTDIQQYNTTGFLIKKKMGNGGDPVMVNGNGGGGRGGFKMYDAVTAALLYSGESIEGRSFGGGGAAGAFNTGTGSFGSNGAPGTVFIHY